MPPKKKQQQIDISLLPQCVSVNSIILCSGRKQRSQKIINKLFTQYKSIFSKINKSEILQHAKQKNIYIDPLTLNDKQKKDPKFMESISTELTPNVIAKATKSFIETMNVKVRIQLKNQNQKPENQKIKPLFQKKLDQIYSFQDFPQTKEEFQALAKINQNIKYIFVINPLITWAGAPEIPQPQQGDPQQDQQPIQQDDQLKQLKQLKLKQQLKADDISHNQVISNRIKQITNSRSLSQRDSIFRDCIIEYIDCQIDPYNEQKSMMQVMKSFIGRIQRLNLQYDQYLGWKKDKVQEQIIKKNEITQVQEGVEIVDNKEQVKSNQYKAQFNAIGENINQILINFVDCLFGTTVNPTLQDDDIEGLINNFNFQQKLSLQSFNKNQNISHLLSQENQFNKKKQYFYTDNQNIYQSQQARKAQIKIRSNLQYPGLNRYLMPDISIQSSPLRKYNRAQYVQFLGQQLPFQQFQRRLSLHKFEQIIKQIDEDRHYNFNDRIYEQNHSEKSLMRQLYRVMAMNQGHFLTKYNEQNDKLYALILYKNNQRRGHVKKWQANWKVLPNYQSWLKYFKQNQNNFNCQTFYDIDYQKIGHINDQVYAFSVPDGGVVINKQTKVAGKTNNFLYGIKNHHVFGINNNIFFSENKSVKVYHYNNIKKSQDQEEAQDYQSIIQLNQNMKLRLRQSGDVIIQSKSLPNRMYTPDGYTVIYDTNNQKSYKILHPTGGVTGSDRSYINQKGFGLKNNIIQYVPTLLRRTQQFQIVKRDDNTITVRSHQQNGKKWIKFYQGTEYLIENGNILIQKQNLPFVKCNAQGINIQINDLLITGEKVDDNNDFYSFTIQYADGNRLKICKQKIQISQTLSNIPYAVDIAKKQFNIQFDKQIIQVSKQKIRYFKNNKEFNPIQNQENFSQNQILPEDCIQPRLFIISPDNTGVQLLNQKQLEYFFSLKSNPKNNVISTTSTKHYQTIHIVSKLISSEQLNKKRILPDFNINLDIFKSQKHQPKSTKIQRFAVRSFIRHKLLQNEDQEQLQSIKQKHQTWLKFIKKQQNEFGYKQKNDPSIGQLQKQKKIIISFRKKQLQKVDFDKLKEQAINQWRNRQKQQLNQMAKQQQEQKIINKMKKRKKSITQEYLPLVIKEKQQSDDTENYSPAGFYSHYFETTQGKKALAGMPEWVFRPKTAKQQKQLDPEIVSELNNTMNKIKKQDYQQIQQQHKQRYDTVDFNINPARQIIIKPSVFTQRQIDQERVAFEQQKKAYFYHQKKRKDFDVYGTQRGKKVQVKSLLRTQPISEINQKYLITEAPFDKKIKIASMKNKLTSQASSLVEMRKQGPHNTLLKTLDKRNDYNQLLEKRTMMVHADLNDKLQRDILITPVEANFGFLKQGRTYEFRINVKNEDILAQRLVVKKPRQFITRVHMSEMGPIALGMSRKIIIQLKAASQYLGRFTDDFQIVSKHQIYRIPVTATILTQSQFENEKVALANGVKQIQQIMKRKTGQLPPIN